MTWCKSNVRCLFTSSSQSWAQPRISYSNLLEVIFYPWQASYGGMQVSKTKLMLCALRQFWIRIQRAQVWWQPVLWWWARRVLWHVVMTSSCHINTSHSSSSASQYGLSLSHLLQCRVSVLSTSDGQTDVEIKRGILYSYSISFVLVCFIMLSWWLKKAECDKWNNVFWLVATSRAVNTGLLLVDCCTTLNFATSCESALPEIETEDQRLDGQIMMTC